MNKFLSQKILHPFSYTTNQMSAQLVPPVHRSIAVLVNRIIYYPLIQSVLYLSSYWLPVIVFLSPIGYLALFLKMQPFAFDHLKYRLGCCGLCGGSRIKPEVTRTSFISPVSTVRVTTTTINPALTSSLSFDNSTNDMNYINPQSLGVDLVDYDAMEDDELVLVISNFSAGILNNGLNTSIDDPENYNSSNFNNSFSSSGDAL